MSEDDKKEEGKEKEIKLEEDFDAIFDEAIAVDGGEKITKTEDGEQKSEDGQIAQKEGEQDNQAEKKTSDTPDGQKKETETTEGGASIEKTGDAKLTYESLEQKYKSLQGMIESKQRETETLTSKVKEFEDKFKAIDEAGKVKPRSDDVVTEEQEDPQLQEYLKDYAYVSANEAKLRQKDLKALKGEILTEISKTYDIPIKSVERLIEERTEDKSIEHVGRIVEAHEDYGKDFTEREINEWVGTLSPAVKKVYAEIITDGDTDEVIDLISKYKEANNIVTSKKTEEEGDSSDEDEDGKKVEVNDGKKEKDKRLESLEIVRGKKTPVGGGGRKKADTFEDAFEEASGGKK